LVIRPSAVTGLPPNADDRCILAGPPRHPGGVASLKRFIRSAAARLYRPAMIRVTETPGGCFRFERIASPRNVVDTIGVPAVWGFGIAAGLFAALAALTGYIALGLCLAAVAFGVMASAYDGGGGEYWVEIDPRQRIVRTHRPDRWSAPREEPLAYYGDLRIDFEPEYGDWHLVLMSASRHGASIPLASAASRGDLRSLAHRLSQSCRLPVAMGL